MDVCTKCSVWSMSPSNLIISVITWTLWDIQRFLYLQLMCFIYYIDYRLVIISTKITMKNTFVLIIKRINAILEKTRWYLADGVSRNLATWCNICLIFESYYGGYILTNLQVNTVTVTGFTKGRRIHPPFPGGEEPHKTL